MQVPLLKGQQVCEEADPDERLDEGADPERALEEVATVDAGRF